MTGNQIEIMAFHHGLELGKKFAVNEFGHSKQRLLSRVMAINQTFISRSINIPIEDPDHLEVWIRDEEIECNYKDAWNNKYS